MNLHPKDSSLPQLTCVLTIHVSPTTHTLDPATPITIYDLHVILVKLKRIYSVSSACTVSLELESQPRRLNVATILRTYLYRRRRRGLLFAISESL